MKFLIACLFLSSVNAFAAMNGAKVTPASPNTTGGGYVSVAFTTSNQVYDTGGHIGTNQFVAQNDGIHTVSAYATTGAVNSSLSFRYRVNSGSWLQICGSSNVSGWPLCSGSDDVMLSDGDTVEFEVGASTSSVQDMRLSISQ